jgi:hypothetical protein
MSFLFESAQPCVSFKTGLKNCSMTIKSSQTGEDRIQIQVSEQKTLTPEQLSHHGLELSATGHVQWRKDCTDHPRNWSRWRKTYDTSVVMFLEFYTWVFLFSLFHCGDYVAEYFELKNSYKHNRSEGAQVAKHYQGSLLTNLSAFRSRANTGNIWIKDT